MKINEFRMDVSGRIIGLMLCVITWYRDYFQYVFGEIKGMFQGLGILLVVVTVFDIITSPKRQYLLYNTPIAIKKVFAYIMLTYLFGFLVSPDPQQHMTLGISYVEYSIIMIVVCYYVISRMSVDLLLWSYCLLGIVLCVTFLSHPVQLNTEGIIRYSLFENYNPNTLAFNLLFGVWAALFLAMKNRFFIIPAFLITSISAYASLLTGSKKSIVYFLLCISLWLMLCYVPLTPRKNISKQIVKIITLLVVIAIATYHFLPILIESPAFQRMLISSMDQSTIDRTSMYELGFSYILKSPILGYGFWGFLFFYGEVYSHSNYIEVFVSSGIPLGILYFSSYLDFFRSAMRKCAYSKSRNLYIERVEVMMGVILLAIILVGAIGAVQIYDLTHYYCLGMLATLCFDVK